MDKKLMKAIGIIMLIAGLAMFFSNMRVTSFSFGRSGAIGIIMLLMGIDFILMVVKPNKIFYVIFGILIVALIITVILNMRVFLHTMSFLKWSVIAVLMFGGIGLVLKSMIKN